MPEVAQAAPPVAEKPAAVAKPRFTARLRYARISARKMRYVVDLIRGKDYNQAIAILRVCPKRGAMFCKKLLESAYENAMDIARNKNMDIDGNKLTLVEARVDPGPIIKRWRPSSVRRPYQIKKRLCHVFLALEERDLKESRRERAKRQRQEKRKGPPSPGKSPAAAGLRPAEAAGASAAQAGKPAPAPESSVRPPEAAKAPTAEQKKTGRKAAGEAQKKTERRETHPTAEQKKTARKTQPPKTERKEKKDDEGKEEKK